MEVAASSAAEAAVAQEDDGAVDVRITANTKIKTCVAFAVEMLQVMKNDPHSAFLSHFQAAFAPPSPLLPLLCLCWHTRLPQSVKLSVL